MTLVKCEYAGNWGYWMSGRVPDPRRMNAFADQAGIPQIRSERDLTDDEPSARSRYRRALVHAYGELRPDDDNWDLRLIRTEGRHSSAGPLWRALPEGMDHVLLATYQEDGEEFFRGTVQRYGFKEQDPMARNFVETVWTLDGRRAKLPSDYDPVFVAAVTLILRDYIWKAIDPDSNSAREYFTDQGVPAQ